MKKVTLALLLVFFSINSFAAEWVGPLKVEDVSFSLDEGTFDRIQLRVTFEQVPTSTTCNTSKKLAIFNYGVESNTLQYQLTQIWYSGLLAAQAQNKSVKMLVDRCEDDNTPNIHGIKVIKD